MRGVVTIGFVTVHAHTNHYGWPWLFFNNLFWSSMFYFRQFDPNLRSVASNFLVKSGIKIIWTEMKRTSNMSDVLEVSGKIHFGYLTLKITQII